MNREKKQDRISANKVNIKKTARMGVLVALAMIFSYVEVLVPIPVGIPGMKLGLANIVVVIGLYLFSPGEVFLISLVRIMLMSLLFGNGAVLIYSLTGGLLSFLVMTVCKMRSKLSIVGISILGGVFHNIGQLGIAILLLDNMKIAVYLPVLLVSGVVTGMGIGWISLLSIKTLKHAEMTY